MDGDVVFANSTCYSEKTMRAITSQAERLRPGAAFISFAQKLKLDMFELKDEVGATRPIVRATCAVLTRE